MATDCMYIRQLQEMKQYATEICNKTKTVRFSHGLLVAKGKIIILTDFPLMPFIAVHS